MVRLPRNLCVGRRAFFSEESQVSRAVTLPDSLCEQGVSVRVELVRHRVRVEVEEGCKVDAPLACVEVDQEVGIIAPVAVFVESLEV